MEAGNFMVDKVGTGSKSFAQFGGAVPPPVQVEYSAVIDEKRRRVVPKKDWSEAVKPQQSDSTSAHMSQNAVTYNRDGSVSYIEGAGPGIDEHA